MDVPYIAVTLLLFSVTESIRHKNISFANSNHPRDSPDHNKYHSARCS